LGCMRKKQGRVSVGVDSFKKEVLNLQ